MISTQFIQAVTQQISVFMIIMARLSATFATLTIFRQGMIPARVVVLFCVVLTLFVLMSGRLDNIAHEFTNLELFYHLILQIFLGVIIGFIVNLFIELFIALGQIISTQSGLGFVNLYIPKVGSITPLSQFFIIMASVIFFELNGHLVLIKMSINSLNVHFSSLGHIHLDDLKQILWFAKIIFSGSMMLSLSVIIALLISNITIAVMTKFAQQINVFTIGINISLIICFFIVYISFDAIFENGTILLNDCLSFAEKIEQSVIQYD